MSYATNSSTVTKPRQPLSNHSDIQFAKLVNHMASTGERPSEDELQAIQTYQDELSELIDALEQDGIAGFNNTLQSLLKNNRRMASTLATITPVEQDQEELHPDIKIGKKGKKVYVTLSEDEIEDFPDATYLVAGTLQTATVSMLFGESNTGKTFVGLHTAQCVGRGIHWLGRPVEAGPVLYIYAEGKLGLKPRLRAWRKHYQLPTTSSVQYIAHPVQMLSERETLIDTIAEQEVTPVLVIIDTFSNCAIGTNQNDQMEVAKILATAHEIAREYGSHVMVIHHTNRAGTVNGSAAFRNHVDTMIELSRDGKDGPITLRCEKQRDAGYFSDIRITLKIEDLGIDSKSLEPLASCVVVAGPVQETVNVSHTEQKMLEILTLHGRASYNTWKRACEDEKVCKPTAFSAHVSTLLQQQRVKKDDSEGPGKRVWYEVVQTSSLVQTSSDELAGVGTN